MRSRHLTIAAISTLLLRSASALAFTGFPLTNDLWETEQDLHQPVRQLFAAIQERAVAAKVEPISFVETVDVARYGVYVPGSTGSAWLNGFYDDPLFQPNPPWLHGGPDADGLFLVTVGPYSYEWVLPTEAEDDGWGFWDILVEWEVDWSISNAVVSATLTNSIGDYSVEIAGTNYTGATQVTRPLLTAMWQKINEIAPKYAYPGAETNWADWWDSPASKIFSPIVTGTTSNDAWTAAPYLPVVSLSASLHKRGFDVPQLETNVWGIVTGGQAQQLPVATDSDYWTARVLLGSAYYSGTNWASTTNWIGTTNAYAQGAWGTNNVFNPHGIDYAAYFGTGQTAVVEYHGTSVPPPSVTVNLSGWAVVPVVTNRTVTNVVWDGDWPGEDGTLDCEETVIYYTNRVPQQVTETLAISNRSAHLWSVITSVDVTGLGTNTDAISVNWAVDRWVPIDYRLYAEELNRMYYVLSDMRWTVPFAVSGRPSANSPRVVVPGAYHGTAVDLTNSIVKRSGGGASYFSTLYPPPGTWPSNEPYPGESSTRGEFYRPSEQPDTIEDWPYTTIPEYWPHEWGDTNDVPVIITVLAYPGEFAAVSTEVYNLAKPAYTTTSATGTVYLPYAYSHRAVGWDEPHTAIPFPTNAIFSYDAQASVVTEWMGSANLAISIYLPTNNYTGQIFLGDFSDAMSFAHLNCASGTLYEGCHGGPDDTISAGPGEVLSGAYPPYLYDTNTWVEVTPPYPFDGNGVLDAPRVMTAIDIGEAGTNLTYTITGCTGMYPERAETPSIPAWGSVYEGLRLQDTQARGYHTTHLYVVLDWDFEYR
jgi:hypothetical protein